MNEEIYFLNRPESGNSIDVKVAADLLKEIKGAVKSGQQGFIIASQNKNLFCSGGDLKAYAKMKTKQQGVKVNATIRKVLADFAKQPIAIVAAIEGDCFGGGCELALACDRIIASQNAQFAFKQKLFGLTQGWGGMAKLLARVGPGVAFDWLATGRNISAVEAFRLGLVDEIVSPGKTLTSAQEFIESFGEPSQKYLSALKSMLHSKTFDEGKIFDSLWYNDHQRELLKRF